MNIYIKNMVCDRCMMAVRRELEHTGLQYRNIQLGLVELADAPAKEQIDLLRERLQGLGFELLDDKKSRTVERIKNTIVGVVHRNDEGAFNMKLSALLEEKLGMEYHYLSSLFSSVEGVTIEKYAILQRIERIKELLLYDEQSLSQIADSMGYSSVQHLSQQFKKVTGMTPSRFRQLQDKGRRPLDQL